MLRLLGNPKWLCQGLRRRDILHIGGLGAFGLALADDLALRRARATPPGKGRVRSRPLVHPHLQVRLASPA